MAAASNASSKLLNQGLIFVAASAGSMEFIRERDFYRPPINARAAVRRFVKKFRGP